MYAMSEGYDRLLEQTLQDIKSTQHDHSKMLYEIKEQTTRTNGKVMELREWRKSAEKQLRTLSRKKEPVMTNLSSKTIYILALIVLATLFLLGAALGTPLDWLIK